MYKINDFEKHNKKAKLIGKIASIIFYIIAIPIIIFSFTLIIKTFINPNEIPDFFGYKSFIIISGSMEPTIMTGDAIFVKEVPESEIKVNDIISFKEKDGENITTHRIIEIKEEDGIKKYKTKGDNNNAEDKNLTTYNQIEGKYLFKINNFGTISNILQNKIFLIILIVLIVFIYWYSKRLKDKKQIRRQKRLEYNEKREK